jgi:hypothetical protein
MGLPLVYQKSNKSQAIEVIHILLDIVQETTLRAFDVNQIQGIQK